MWNNLGEALKIFIEKHLISTVISVVFSKPLQTIEIAFALTSIAVVKWSALPCFETIPFVGVLNVTK